MTTRFGGAPQPLRWGFATFNGELVYEGMINDSVVASLNATYPAGGLRIKSSPIVLENVSPDTITPEEEAEFEKVYASAPDPLPVPKPRPKLSVVTDDASSDEQPQLPRPTGGFKPRIVK